MELSPRLYRLFVRPPFLTKHYFNSKLNSLVSSFSFENKLVLDFGCGIGSSCSIFQPDYYIGIDCDEKRLDYARYLYPEYNFISSEKHIISLKDNSIDYVLISAVLHHIPTNIIEQYLKEFRRILKSDGQIIVIEPCFYKNSYLSNWFMASFDKGRFIRNKDDYLSLFHGQSYSTECTKRFKKCLVYNEIFFTAQPCNSKNKVH